ncbi:hypothetical protein CONCODRAFT_6242 [Conidiobolus coronatus NRRL 28638]|uniref:G-protein coupled receptors family 1 profile domain-containing protein n=1 Tax=Conidiobolus coronatus (strain ATCC 28846 / CBS 209.66 / NRRL 28638) TaxID=796925 RepID=A0A137P839_CONC2|nr:hypothetical protein CONCODRAFT_6242 [Conidiobolus coronatus NRRL 28638]|eukprot:KXN71139.1 hypothetical protein CONCODRAFT_6242 [Conidiobolus coronatus NRRL 28638]
MTFSILILNSVTSIVLIIIKISFSDISQNEGYIFCSLNFKSNAPSKIIELALGFSACLFLVTFSICYFNIGRAYYKGIRSLEASALELDKRYSIELNSLNARRKRQIHDNSNDLESINLCNNSSNSNQIYKPKFQVIKLLSILKSLSLIIIPFIEILPIALIHILNHYVEISDYELIENICYWIVEFIPLTNPLMVLFLHRETWVEFYHLIDRK